MSTRVVLHGELATAMGRAEWHFEIQQPREVLAALEANTGELYRYLSRRHDESQGAVQYRVIVDGRDLGAPDPSEVPAGFYLVGVYAEIHIVPVLAGGAGLWQTIIGVVLIIVAVVLFFIPGGQAIAPYVLMAGISLTLSGVAQMLSPSPKLPQGASTPFGRTFNPPTSMLQQKQEKPENTPSYLFGGAVNTTQQGNPVPVCYGGPIIVGSALLSMAITSATIEQSIIGSQRVPPADAPELDLPVWDRLAADARRQGFWGERECRALKPPGIETMRVRFGLPSLYPVTWPTVAQRGKPVPMVRGFQRPKMHYMLRTVAYLFTGDPRPIRFREALDLYQLLGLTNLDQPERQSWAAVVLSVALHFSPNP